MPATFLAFLLYLALWPAGLVAFFGAAGFLFVSKYRRFARSALIWGLAGALAIAIPLGWFGLGMIDPRFEDRVFSLLFRPFFAGFSLGILAWYVLRYRTLRRASAV